MSYPGREYDFIPCRMPACGACAISPTNAIALHHDCLIIFLRECQLQPDDALARLWTIGCYRNPWPKVPLLRLAPHECSDPMALQKIADMSGFPWLPSLPSELIELIRRADPHTLFWRAIATITAAGRLMVPSRPPQVLALRDIEAWERGGTYILRGGAVMDSGGIVDSGNTVRLEIDSDGICKICRLATAPEYRPGIATGRAYIVEKDDVLANIQAYFKDGLVQLRLPPDVAALRVWNTPAPPPWRNYFHYNWSDKLPWQHFRVVDWATIRGVTFFFSWRGRLSDVHVHSESEPCALSTFARLSNRQQRFTLWTYLPISRFDTVIAMGVWGLSEILIRTRLMGDVWIGARHREQDNRLVGGNGQGIALVYGEPRGGEDVPFIGGYCPAWQGRLSPRLRPRVPRPTSGLDDKMYFSCASLDAVSSVHVFYDRENGLCWGILFEYENGGLRSVGQCRLHIDLRRRYTRPSKVCFRTRVNTVLDWRRKIHGVDVEFQCGHESGDGWQCKTLSGTLLFWFSNQTSLVSVEQTEGNTHSRTE